MKNALTAAQAKKLLLTPGAYRAPELDNPIILGIDSSSKTGIAVIREHDGGVSILHTERVHFPNLKGLHRLQAIQAAILNLVTEYKPTFAVIEGYGYNNKFTLATLVEIGTAIRLQLIANDVLMGTITPKSLKKFVTGNGSATKPQMIAQAKARWGYITKDDNVADALGLAVAGLAYCSRHIKITDTERAIVNQLTLLHASANAVKCN